MAARQRIMRIRRDYNQWVANQTLEDYALRFTAKRARKWSASRVANTALGGISFLALEAIGGTITLGYGFTNAVAAILLVGILIFAAGVPISVHAARDGVDIDLLTRGAGFGYLGSTITSLIYASFTFIFFAIEAAILATMLQTCLGIPPPIGYLICALAMVPLVTHGITFISRVQLWSQPLWIVLQVLPFAVIAWTARDTFAQWTSYAGTVALDHAAPGHAAPASFNLLLFGQAASVVFSLVAQIGEQADYLRFLPEPATPARRLGWWAALLAGGPGWIVIGTLKLLAGSFLACLALAAGLDAHQAAQPTEMYRVAFGYVVASPAVALALAGVFVAVSQVKINITNAYAGSIAWSNFFSRLTHSHPGRVVWLTFNIAIAVLLMELGIYRAIERTLAMYAVIAAAWVGALTADLVLNKPLGFSPRRIEFKRAHLYDINPVGTGAMLLAVALGLAAYAGLLGAGAQAFSPFAAFATAFAAAPLIAWATQGRYYLARKPRAGWVAQGPRCCVICENAFDAEDMAFCPAYAGAICSLCCSLDARCHDSCKPQARLSRQIAAPLRAVLPPPLAGALAGSLGRSCALFALFAAVIGVILLGIYSRTARMAALDRDLLAPAFWTAFCILIPIAGIAAWLLVLAQESRRVAQEETRRQTALLFSEIDAHKRTDAKLEKARAAAEAANLAKSRYVVGISHELRSPLNAILGYAHLIEGDASVSAHRREHVRIIRRSGEHMAGLIEGLLDIAKIEAGRIEIYRDEVRLGDFLAQLVSMFRLQAEAKGIAFTFTRPDRMPGVVYTDERRLRQILINLLSNAIKFTDAGEVHLGVRWRSEIAEFTIEDTGRGITQADLDRIFEPFQRVEHPDAHAVPGIGLGLTITRLLTQIMGGELTVSSSLGTGSRFSVRLMLSAALQPRHPAPPETRILGYAGRMRTVLVADDDPVHRGLMQDVLSPLGFTVFHAASGEDCLRVAAQCQPDLLLVDISMPGMDGWQVARRLRDSGHDQMVIIVLSANAGELPNAGELHRPPGTQAAQDAVLTKPVMVHELLARIGALLRIEWTQDAPPAPDTPALGALTRGALTLGVPASGMAARLAVPLAAPASPEPPPPGSFLDARQREELRQLGMIGYVRGIHAQLDAIAHCTPQGGAAIAQLRLLVSQFQLEAFMAALGPEAPGE